MSKKLSEEGEYIVSTFLEKFEKYKNEPIALYGVGINTEILLNNIKGFNIVGLMDLECVGQVVYGKKVLSYDEVAKKCKKIVIVARKSVINIIYKRISFFEKNHNIKIYDIEGKEFDKDFVEKDENNDLIYWNTSEKQIKQLIDKYNVISFDIFDTLITRRILKPTDIFNVVERVLLEKYEIKINFKEIRIKCEKKLNESYPAPKFDQIYDEIQKELQLSEDIKELIKKIEYEIEYKYIIPRKKMIEIYKYALDKNKQVYLLSDMYLDKEKIKELLKKCGISGNINILISCEINKTKYSGELFEYYKELVKDKSMLHIGDNIKADIEKAKKYDIETFQVLNPYDMLVYSSYRKILTNISTIEESNILGLIISKAFNDPFVLNKSKGRFIASDLKNIGYIFLGPVILNFMVWLINELLDSEFEVILFSARDGYLINILYKIMTENIKKGRMPHEIYFKTSRRAITVPTIESQEDILFILKKPFKCTKKQLLKERFGIELDRYDVRDNELVVSGENIESISNYILSYKNEIIKNAMEEKKYYMEYINSIGVINKENIAIFDFCSSGTIQFYLSKLISKDLHGFYFATMNLPNMFYKDSSKISTLFGNAKQYYSKFNLTKYYMLLESILTDPNNTLIRCESNNNFVYNDGETTIKDFDNIKKCHDGIIEFVQDIIEIDNKIVFRDIDIEFTDYIFGLFVSKKTEVVEKVRNTFFTESCYDFSPEYNVWESL